LGLGLAAVAARAGEPKLRADEGIVLCRGTVTTLRYVEYRRVGARDDFYVMLRGVLTPRVVKAGRYYLRTYSTIYRNVFPPAFPEPAATADTVEVRAGSVTYVGDLTATQNRGLHRIWWSFALALNSATLLQARKSFPWLQKYPLYVARAGGEVVPVRWSTEPPPAPPPPGEQRYGGAPRGLKRAPTNLAVRWSEPSRRRQGTLVSNLQ